MKNVALVTGVSREQGLGYAVAQQLKEKGFQVIITARELSKAEILAEQSGLIAMELDITNDESVSTLAREIESNYGKLDVLINNAGAFFDQGNEPLDTDMQFTKEALNTNLLGAWRIIKAFHALLEKSDAPRIVNVSSGAGSYSDSVFGLGYHFSKVPVYGITKLALNGLTVKIATQLKDSKIKINSVDPGFTATYPGTEQWGARPAGESAKGVVWAVTPGRDDGACGFFKDGEPVSW